jgi:hypothetical protein
MSLQAVSTVRPLRQSTPTPSWSDGRDAIRAAVRELRQCHPRAGEQQIARLLTERLEVDGELLEAGAVFLTHDAMTAERVRRVRSAPTPKARAALRAMPKRLSVYCGLCSDLRRQSDSLNWSPNSS